MGRFWDAAELIERMKAARGEMDRKEREAQNAQRRYQHSAWPQYEAEPVKDPEPDGSPAKRNRHK